MWYLLTELYSRKFGVLWFHWFQAWSKDRGVSLIFQARSIPVSTLVWRKRHKVSYFQCSHSRSKRCVVTSTLVQFCCSSDATAGWASRPTMGQQINQEPWLPNPLVFFDCLAILWMQYMQLIGISHILSADEVWSLVLHRLQVKVCFFKKCSS